MKPLQESSRKSCGPSALRCGMTRRWLPDRKTSGGESRGDCSAAEAAIAKRRNESAGFTRGASLLIQRFVQVQELARHHGERGELGRGQGGIGFGVANGEEGFGALGAGGEFLFEVARAVGD